VGVAPEDLESGHRRQVVGEQLPVYRHNVRPLSGGGEGVDIREVPAHWPEL